MLSQFVSSTTCIDFPQSFAQLNQIFGDEFQENMALSTFLDTSCVFAIEEHTNSYTIPCEVSHGKFLHINAGLSKNQKAQLLKVLKKKAGAFAWEYTNMKGYTPRYLYSPYLYGSKHVTCKEAIEEDESFSKGYSKRRITKTPH